MNYRLRITALIVLLGVGFTGEADTDDCKSASWIAGYRGVLVAENLRHSGSCRTLLYFSNDYCAPCKLLKQKLFSSKEFLHVLKSFTKVELTFPGDWRERHLASKLDVRSVPSLFVSHKSEEGEDVWYPIKLHYTDSAGSLKLVPLTEAVESIQAAGMGQSQYLHKGK